VATVCHPVALAEVIDRKRKEEEKGMAYAYHVCHAELRMGKPLDRVRRLQVRFSTRFFAFSRRCSCDMDVAGTWLRDSIVRVGNGC
jgi:hypothetical protein